MLVCAMALFVMTGCERQIAPPLVEVTELAPLEIETSDRLEVHGTGFPQGRTARVTLSGAVFRPGEAPMRNVSIEAEGVVTTPGRLEIVVRDGFIERFCGRGDRAAHATFAGDVELSFASSTPGAPPLVGVLRNTSIDVMPVSPRATVLDARAAEGGRLLAFLGIVPGAPTPRGLPIEQVGAQSLAERSGMQVGDVIVSLDGVHVLSVGDIIPASARSAELTIRHADSGTEETKTLPLIEYSGERIPTEYAPALLLVGVALAFLVILVLPGPPSLAALEMRIASRLRRTTLRTLLGALVGQGRHAALSAIVSAVIATFALTPYLVGREVDGVVLLAGAATLLVWSRMAAERGVLASLRTLVRVGLVVLSMSAAIVLAIGQVGAIELAEIVRVQGGAPWQFTAARYPACTVLLVVYSVATVAILRTRRPDGWLVTSGASAERSVLSELSLGEAASAPPPHAAFLERAGVLLVSALGVATFLGGWQLPMIVDPRSHGLLLVSGGAFVVKTWLFAGLLLGASRVGSSLEPKNLQSLVLKRLLPGLLLAGAAVAVSRRLLPSVAIEAAVGATLVALAVLLFVRMVARVRAALARPEPHASTFL
jgi:NADH-quinone oxidoreductase subunit H